jgi:hypothetical protein
MTLDEKDGLYTMQRYECCPHYPWGRLLEKADVGCEVCADIKPTHRIASVDIENKIIHFEAVPEEAE